MNWLFGPPNVKKLHKKRDIKKLIQALRYNKDGHIRQGAAEALGNIAEKGAIDPLIAALSDADSDVRTAVAEALGKIGIDRLLPVQQAIYYIYTCNPAQARKIGEPIVEPSIAAINDKDRNVRETAVELLGRIGGPKAKACLLTALKNKNQNEDTRRDIAEMLEKMGYKPADTPELIDCWIEFEKWEKLLEVDKLAKDSLITRMKDKNSNSYTRMNIATLLMNMGASWGELADTVEPAMVSLIAEIKGIQHGYMLSRRVDALAWKGNTLVVEPLVTALNSIVLHSTDQAEKICAIAKTLGRIGDSRAVDPLLSLLQFEDLPGHHGPAAQVHNAAIWALGEIGDEKAIESLIAVFKSDSCDRKTIIEALTKIGVSQDIKQILMSTIISDPIEDKAYNISCLELLGWTPKTEEEQIDYYLEKEDVSGLRKIGRPAIDRMINLFRQIPHIPASESLSYSGSFGSRILVCLGEMDDKAAQDVLITQLKGKGRFCKIARDVLNRGKSYEEEHCLCPKCFTYMGVRNHLRSKGTQVSDQMRQEARQNKMVIIGDSYSRCPGCGERILV